MKKFEIPEIYRSPLISKIKEIRKINDPRKKDFLPTVLDFGPVRFFIARHFGFCYGVENAIEVSNRIIDENPGKRIYLLSEMIHNPLVNEELRSRGVEFLMDNAGNRQINWDKLSSDDIVIIPAFGTTLEIEQRLTSIGIDTVKYNTTCPFVEKVWNRSNQLGENNYTVVIHGKYNHEETRATFSHSNKKAPSVIIRNIEEAGRLGRIISGEITHTEFYKLFESKYSDGFNAETDLNRIGVVNQTTMLATETQEIADLLKDAMEKKYGKKNLSEHFADTRDTLCYATTDNQQATYEMLNQKADIAIVVGGYNSSNTGHIVELCEEKIPTYFISGPDKIISSEKILHFNIHEKAEKKTSSYLPRKHPVDIMLTSGASCPDSVVEGVLNKILSFFTNTKDLSEVLSSL